MILALLLALLAFLSALPILLPLLRSNRPIAGRESYDQAVYRDQLQELDRDIARGLLTNVEADTARLEIQRRLLAADRQPSRVARLSRSPALAGVLFVFVLGGSLALYLTLGAPGLPDIPFGSRGAQMAQSDAASSLRKASEELAGRLKQNASDPDGWVLYGRSLAELGEWDKAADAYGHALALGRNDANVVGAHAEMLVMQAGGTVTPVAEAAFKTLLAIAPNDPVARYYLGLARLQAGEPAKAVEAWQGLLAELPADSPMRQQIGTQIMQAAQQAGLPPPKLADGRPAATAPGPDAQAMANASNMTDEQRTAMIRGMVESLAAKQKADPSNLDGWLRLGRAYGVLKEADKAADAFEQAASLKPNDVSIQLQEAQALLSGQDATARLSPRVLALLQKVQAADPNQPIVLWYLGLNAAQDHQPFEAREYWSALLRHIPADSQDAKMVRQALDALPKGDRSSGG